MPEAAHPSPIYTWPGVGLRARGGGVNYEEIEVPDALLCESAFTEDRAPDLLIAAAWAINGYRCSAEHLQQEEPQEDVDVG